MSGIVTWCIFAKEAFLRPDTFFEELEVYGYGIPFSFSLLSIAIAAYTGTIALIVRSPVLLQSTHDLLFLLIYATLIGLIGGTIIVGLWSALTHLFVHLLGGTGLQDTVVTTAYTTAVIGFLGWTPVIGHIVSPYLSYGMILAVLAYMVYVTHLGLQHRHDLSTSHAVLGAVLPVLAVGISGAALYHVEPALLEQIIVIPERIALELYLLVI